jgi:hypothetical protein
VMSVRSIPYQPSDAAKRLTNVDAFVTTFFQHRTFTGDAGGACDPTILDRRDRRLACTRLFVGGRR